MDKTPHPTDKPAQEEPPIRIDIERMSRALASGYVAVPAGLPREEVIRFILAAARKG